MAKLPKMQVSVELKTTPADVELLAKYLAVENELAKLKATLQRRVSGADRIEALVKVMESGFLARKPGEPPSSYPFICQAIHATIAEMRWSAGLPIDQKNGDASFALATK